MPSVFCRLTEAEERLAISWQTKKRSSTPTALDRLIRVVHVVEDQYLSENFDHWFESGSVTFRHKTIKQFVVRVWIDDDNRLSRHFGLSMTPLPIVVGVDLTSHSPIERKAIRDHLRGHFHYVNPEDGPLPVTREDARKVDLMPIRTNTCHPLDILFLPDGPCNVPIYEKRFLDIYTAMQEESGTWNHIEPVAANSDNVF